MKLSGLMPRTRTVGLAFCCLMHSKQWMYESSYCLVFLGSISCIAWSDLNSNVIKLPGFRILEHGHVSANPCTTTERFFYGLPLKSTMPQGKALLSQFLRMLLN
jgi:hypothetical protein